MLTADTHMQANAGKWPDGDVLIVAGDLTGLGTLKEIASQTKFFSTLPYQHKIIVAGNHDFLFQDEPMIARLQVEEKGMIYLEDQGTTIEDVSFFGSPWCPSFGRWAFMRDRGRALKDRWAYIPTGVDVLITHGPPAGIGDLTIEGEHAGDTDLLWEVSHRIKPRLHVFGHIHEGYGMYPVGDTIYVNASRCNRRYQPVQEQIVFDIEAQERLASAVS